jgi:hypothetical protein
MSDDHIYKNSTTNQSTENADRKYIDKMMSNTLNKNITDNIHQNKTNTISDKSLINMPKNIKPRANNLNMIDSFHNDMNLSIKEMENKGMLRIYSEQNITERTICDEMNQAEKNIDKME